MENKPLETDPQGQNVSPGEGEKNVSPQGHFSLEEVNKLMGRDYKSIGEAQKGLEEQTSYVGKLGPKAAEWDKLQAIKTPEQRSTEAGNITMDKVSKMEFLIENPEAKSVAEEVQAIAKSKGVSMNEAFNNSSLKKVVELETKKHQAANPTYVESGRLPKGKERITKQAFKNMPLEDARKLVESTNAWNEPISRNQ